MRYDVPLQTRRSDQFRPAAARLAPAPLVHAFTQRIVRKSAARGLLVSTDKTSLTSLMMDGTVEVSQLLPERAAEREVSALVV